MEKGTSKGYRGKGTIVVDASDVEQAEDDLGSNDAGGNTGIDESSVREEVERAKRVLMRKKREREFLQLLNKYG